MADAYDFSTARSVVDVGGGFGALLTAVLQRHRGPGGVLFDLPHVISQAKTRFDPRWRYASSSCLVTSSRPSPVDTTSM